MVEKNNLIPPKLLDSLLKWHVPPRRAFKKLLGHSITFDSASSIQGSAASFSWNHTTDSLSYRLLLVGISIRNSNNQTVSSVTYDGVNLTFLRADTNGTDVRTEIWYLLNPAFGTKTIVLTLSASAKAVCGAITLMGVNQTTPFTNNNGAVGSSTSPSASVTSADDDWLFGVLAAKGTVTATEGSGQTNRWNLVTSGGATASNVRGCGSTKGPVTAGSQSMNWTLSASASWGVSVVSVKEEPGTEIFSDGFESGFTPWTGTSQSGSSTITVSTEYAHHGSYSAKVYLDDPDNLALVYKTITGQTILFVRIYLNISAYSLTSGSWATVILLRDTIAAIDPVLVSLYGANRQLRLRYRSGGTNYDVTSSTTLSLNTAYCLEVKYVKDSTNGEIRVYLDGTEVTDLTQTGKNTAETPNQIKVGACWGAGSGSWTNYIDCVVIANAYIGPEAAGQLYEIFVDAVVKSSAPLMTQTTYNVEKDANIFSSGLIASESIYNILKEAIMKADAILLQELTYNILVDALTEADTTVIVEVIVEKIIEAIASVSASATLELQSIFNVLKNAEVKADAVYTLESFFNLYPDAVIYATAIPEVSIGVVKKTKIFLMIGNIAIQLSGD